MDTENKSEVSMTEKQKEAFLAKFSKNRYHIGKTAKDVGVHRNTILHWRKMDEDFRKAYVSCLEEKIDDSEERLYLLAQGIPKIKNGKLVGWIEKPHVRALEIQLKAQAKDRGYGDSIVIDDQREETHREKTDEQLISEMEAIKDRYKEYDGDEEGEQ